MRQRFFNLTTGTLSDLLDQQISQHETCVRTHVMFAVVPRQRQRVLLEGELLRHVLHVLVHHEAFLLDILSHILSHILAKILRMNKRNLLLLFRRLVVDNKYTPQTTPMFSWPFLLHLLRHLRSVVDLPKTCQRKKRRR